MGSCLLACLLICLSANLLICLRRHNQALEQDSATIRDDRERLEQQAEALSQRLAAVMAAKDPMHGTEFDAETPIDKVLNVMHSYIVKVSGSTHPSDAIRLMEEDRRCGWSHVSSWSWCKGLLSGASLLLCSTESASTSDRHHAHCMSQLMLLFSFQCV